MYEPRSGENRIFAFAKNKGTDQLRSYCKADQRLCFRNTDSTTILFFRLNLHWKLVFSWFIQMLTLGWPWLILQQGQIL